MTTVNQIEIDPQSVIPGHWHNIGATTAEAMTYYGKPNLEKMARYWLQMENEYEYATRKYQSKIDVLRNQTVESLRKIAAQYENPAFPKIGRMSKSLFPNVLGPRDKASKNRPKGATTFNVCGWCKHAIGSIGCRGCHITSLCGLIPMELGDGSGRQGEEEFCFNTPCALINRTDSFIRACVEHLTTKRKEAEECILLAEQKKWYLLNIYSMAKEKPIFSNERYDSHFDVGNRVACFVNFDGIVCKPGFVFGEVVKNYNRNTDSPLSVVTDEQTHDNTDMKDGYGLEFCSPSRPDIMLKEEYDYLKANPDYLEVWLKAIPDRYSSKPEAWAFT
jgi:hypothetical protein